MSTALVITSACVASPDSLRLFEPGVLLWELYAVEIPYRDIQLEHNIKYDYPILNWIVEAELRPTIAPAVDKDPYIQVHKTSISLLATITHSPLFFKLLKSCLATNPQARPAFSTLLPALVSIEATTGMALIIFFTHFVHTKINILPRYPRQSQDPSANTPRTGRSHKVETVVDLITVRAVLAMEVTAEQQNFSIVYINQYHSQKRFSEVIFSFFSVSSIQCFRWR